MSRDTFYRYKSAVDDGGVEALFERTRRKPNLADRVDQATEEAVIKNATDFPAYGQARTSNELRKLGVFVSPSGVRSIWLRHDLANFKNRLKALEAKVAEEGGLLTEAQVQALEKKKLDDEACGEIETAHPGYLGSQDTFYVGTLKGVGRVYQQTYDHLASLATPQGMTAAEQICSAQRIDLEGLQGIQDVLLMLAIDHPKILERVSVQASLMQRTGGKSWSAFQFDDDGKPWALGDDAARAGFVADAIAILDLPDHRKREADWYTAMRVNPITGEETETLQATIYVEANAESELKFGSSDGLERQVVQRVLEVGIACNAKDRIVEICANGGKKIRDEYATSFSKHFAPQSAPPIETPRRDVLLTNLGSKPTFPTEPADGVASVEVSSLEFYSVGGGFARFEQRGDDETIYQFLERQFGAHSPINATGWMIIGATLRIVLAPQDGKRTKTLTVTLRSPNTTTIPNKTEAERQFVINLLERWELLEKRLELFDVNETP